MEAKRKQNEKESLPPGRISPKHRWEDSPELWGVWEVSVPKPATVCRGQGGSFVPEEGASAVFLTIWNSVFSCGNAGVSGGSTCEKSPS